MFSASWLGWMSGAALHLLEVAELVDALDRHLERFGVEDVALVHVDLAPDHLVARRVVAREVELAEEVLLVLLHLHRHVHDLLLRVGLAVGAARPLEVAERAVDVAQLLVGLLEVRVVVDVALLHLEQAAHEALLQHREPLELQAAHPVLRPLGDRDLELHVLDRLLLGSARLVHVADARLADARRHVAVVQVVVLDPPALAARILLAPEPLLLGVGGLAAEPAQVEEARLLDLLHLPAQRRVREHLVAVEGDLLHLRLGALVDHERQLLAGGADVLRLVLDRGEGTPLGRQHLLDDRLDLARLLGVVEGVDLDLRVALLELVLDRAGGDLLAAAVVDDLDPPALGDDEAHDLAARAVDRLDPQVVEEAGVPQPLEVVAQLALVEGLARLRRDVVLQRLALQELVVQDLDPLDQRRLPGWLLRPRAPRERERAEPEQDSGHGERPLHDDSVPPRSSCWYHSPPSFTPTSIGRPLLIWPRMNASDSGSSMWRWIARRSGRAP